MKKVLMVTLVLLLALNLLSCKRTPQDVAENTLIYGSGDYTSINPVIYEHGEINSLIFSGLTARDENNKVVPSLAESWELDKGTSTYIFHLRKNVKWHDGEDFNADDVVFTLNAIMNPDNGSEIASNYEDITSVEAVDSHTVKIVLSGMNVAILNYLTVGIVPEHILAGQDILTHSFNQNPIGTGPYKLANWNMGQSITLEKNADYFMGEPKIEKVIFKIIVDTKLRAMQLESGEIHMSQVTPESLNEFENSVDYRLYDMKTADYRGILYNFNNKLFKENPKLTNALSYAIDRQAIVDSVLLGSGEIAYSPLQMSEYVNKDIEKFDYNPQKAMELLEDDGWVKNSQGTYEKNGTKLSFTINCMEGDQVRVDMANICAVQFKAIGADVTSQVTGDIDWENQAAFLIGWGSPFDPDDHTYKVFGTDKGSNFSAYSNEKVDILLEKARQRENNEKRKEYYQEFQQELADFLPYTFIAYVDALYAVKSDVKGISEKLVLGHHGVGIFYNIATWSMQ